MKTYYTSPYNNNMQNATSWQVGFSVYWKKEFVELHDNQLVTLDPYKNENTTIFNIWT